MCLTDQEKRDRLRFRGIPERRCNIPHIWNWMVSIDSPLLPVISRFLLTKIQLICKLTQTHKQDLIIQTY